MPDRYKPTIDPRTLALREVPLSPPSTQHIHELVAELQMHPAVHRAVFDPRGQSLRVEYDAALVDIDAIEGVMHRNGVEEVHTVAERLRELWYRVMDHRIAAQSTGRMNDVRVRADIV